MVYGEDDFIIRYLLVFFIIDICKGKWGCIFFVCFNLYKISFISSNFFNGIINCFIF